MTFLPPAGWYPDPSGKHPKRYWDGTRWSNRTRSRPQRRNEKFFKVHDESPSSNIEKALGSLALAGMFLIPILLFLPDLTAGPFACGSVSNGFDTPFANTQLCADAWERRIQWMGVSFLAGTGFWILGGLHALLRKYSPWKKQAESGEGTLPEFRE
ncbi:DUF2510 domain-containing protein [Rhodococcus spongiicola]|uniref:DUF2510 domain-containing protein n=1 Tax=Rhodococcus spongiicola TaxID=2487352 RepID=A0A3S3E3A4_9NOCA|nr:DUF2510 domain-containing protein [Rhodococcus spongiicola]RVW04899.1 DUF2510 domain-containing protein [Rhodococcus spongiicola]